MNRFKPDDDDDEDLYPDIEGDEEEEFELELELNAEYLSILEKRELIEVLKLQAIQKELNLTILRKAISFCEKKWFWRFKSTRKKLNVIIEVYQTFKSMVDLDAYRNKEEEEE
jgi:hypothetical protein